MKNQMQVPNLRVIKAKFVFQNGANRVKLFESKRYNDDKTESKVFSYDPDIDNVLDQAIAVLERNDMKVICRGSEQDYYYILCDNWGPEFKKVTELK